MSKNLRRALDALDAIDDIVYAYVPADTYRAFMEHYDEILDALEDITENSAPGIVVPENKEITYQNDHNNVNAVWAYQMDQDGNIRRQYLDSDTKISAPVDAPWTEKKES